MLLSFLFGLHRFDSLISANLLLFADLTYIDGKQYGNEQYNGKRLNS